MLLYESCGYINIYVYRYSLRSHALKTELLKVETGENSPSNSRRLPAALAKDAGSLSEFYSGVQTPSGALQAALRMSFASRPVPSRQLGCQQPRLGSPLCFVDSSIELAVRGVRLTPLKAKHARPHTSLCGVSSLGCLSGLLLTPSKRSTRGLMPRIVECQAENV